jgi:hypothetical protein
LPGSWAGAVAVVVAVAAGVVADEGFDEAGAVWPSIAHAATKKKRLSFMVDSPEASKLTARL